MAPPFLLCESHQSRPLTQHLLDVASRAGVKGGSLWIAGLCHDLGKATAYFQDYLKGTKGDPFLKAHSLFGAFWLVEVFHGSNAPEETLKAALHALFIRCHHGRLDDLEHVFAVEKTEKERCHRRLAAADVEGIARWLGEQLGREPIPTPSFEVPPRQRVRLSRVIDRQITADTAMCRFQEALRDFGSLIAADRGSAAGELADPSAIEKPTLDGSDLDRFRSEGDFGSCSAATALTAARDGVYRSAVSGATLRPAVGGHLWTLQVPTGAGKTLAALGWAAERRRLRKLAGRFGGAIFYALPFTSIIDQTATIIRRLWPEANQLGALAVHHHLADYGSGEEGKHEGARKREWAETWRADVVCTTFVQIAHALFHGTAADSRRFAALAQSDVLILDEAQALPAELWPTLRVALRSLATTFGVDVLLLTATKPALLQDEDAPADLSPGTAAVDLGSTFDRYDVCIEAGPAWSVSELVEAAARSLPRDADGTMRSGLILLNTVNEALAVHALSRHHAAFRDIPLLHLSTNLRPKDRAHILNELRVHERAGGPRLLVATQVVEAGVDLSFDVVFRAEAPLDAIVQAAGRCNRHGNGSRGEVRVFPFRGSSANRIYGDIKMAAAAELLKELARTFARGPIPEPEFGARVPEFFQRIANRMGEAQSKLRSVLEAVTRFEFAKLRGEGPTPVPELRAKHVDLISEDGTKVPVFVETDDHDAEIWSQLVAAHEEPDLRRRRARLREMRSAVGARVVEVPQNLNPPPPASPVGLGHVPQSEAARFYDSRTGWRRPLPNQP